MPPKKRSPAKVRKSSTKSRSRSRSRSPARARSRSISPTGARSRSRSSSSTPEKRPSKKKSPKKKAPKKKSPKKKSPKKKAPAAKETCYRSGYEPTAYDHSVKQSVPMRNVRVFVRTDANGRTRYRFGGVNSKGKGLSTFTSEIRAKGYSKENNIKIEDETGVEKKSRASVHAKTCKQIGEDAEARCVTNRAKPMEERRRPRKKKSPAKKGKAKKAPAKKGRGRKKKEEVVEEEEEEEENSEDDEEYLPSESDEE